MNGCAVGSRRFGAVRAATGVLGWLIAFLTVLSATPAAATPVSSLQFPPSRTGQWAFDAAATVVPHGREMPALDGQGRLTTETRLEYIMGASAAIAYHVTDAVALSLSVEAGGIARRTIRSHGAAGAWEWQTGPATPRLGAEWRLRPGRGDEPALRLEVDGSEPRVVAASWKNSLIRDPVVLVAILSMESPAAAEERGGRASATLAAAFVANHQVSFSASVSHVFSPGFDRVPHSAAAVGVHYSPTGNHRRRVGLETVLHVDGPDLRLGFGVSLSLLGPGR